MIWPQLLKCVIRSAKFIECLPAMTKKNRCRQRLVLQPRSCNKSLAVLEYVALNVPEESERLRRQPVTAARLAMQRVKRFHRLQAAAEIDPQARCLGFADTAPDGAVEPVEKAVGSGGKIDHMGIKRQRR